jgi:hypothetical protein
MKFSVSPEEQTARMEKRPILAGWLTGRGIQSPYRGLS